jgi:uncharacterized ferritin-like protein (DUF455 family)
LSWCLQRLQELGYSYGCMPAHGLLWEGCQQSAHDLAARLAMVPMGQVGQQLAAGGRVDGLALATANKPAGCPIVVLW